MTLETNFNVNPYNDDFDKEKNYYRLLFKPGYAVQARELTQIQSSLQAQIGRFGNHVFKNGSLVTGGEFFIHKAKYIKIQDVYQTAEVKVDEFTKKTIYSNELDEDGNPTKRAEVLKVYDYNPGNGDPKTLLVAQLYGNNFGENEVIRTFEPGGSNLFATTANTAASGDALLFSVGEGVFYYDGYFIRNQPQTVAISKYSYNDANASARIGFEIIESLINSSEDSSLLDPAQEASNYQAPGSDRYKIDLVLVARDLDSTDDNKFIELMRVQSGVVISENKFPIYSVLEDTFARRTYDESGNYTVRPFRITLETNSSNTAKANIVLSPGKAYIFGYEYETISPTTLVIDKPRTTQNVVNEYQTAEYGNFLYTTRHRGSFPINTLETINLHCVPAESINTTSLAALVNTKIGTARVKSVEYFESTDSSNSNTYVYQTFVFDVQINSSISANVVSATNTTVVIANTSLGNFYSTIQNAYRGAKIRIVSGPGSNELPKTIVNFNAATQTVTVSALQEYKTLPTTSSVFSIDFETGDIESFASHSGALPISLVCSGNIENKSRDFSTDYSHTFISARNKEPLIFKIGQDYVTQNSITDLTYSYKRLYKNIQFDGGIATLSSLPDQELESSRREDYYVSVVDSGTSSFSNGQVVPMSLITIDRENGELTISGANNMLADIMTSVKVTGDTFSQAKIKSLVTANVNNVEAITSPIDVFGDCSAIVYPANGVTRISSTILPKVPGTPQSLYVSDVRSIIKIVDIGNTYFSQANIANGINVTSRYTLDNGQRDSFYDHSSIRLNSKSQVPTGNLVVFYERFKSTGAGSFFSVDSYSQIPYENIPSYTATSNGIKYELRDCLDFRPVRKDGEFIFDVYTNPSQSGPGIPGISSAIDLEYEYYLPRIDKVVLDKERKFKIIQGIPSLNPLEPRDSETAMTLFILRYTPYTGNTKEVKIRHIDHKRYTMRDIGRIDKRVENLEYYTALSLLEQQTLSQQDFTILDSQNLPRFKNGILVDNFSGFSATDVENRDYSAGIDSEIKQMVPRIDDEVYDLDFDSGSNYMISGSLITRAAQNVEFIYQPKASLSVNVNPFNVVRFEGTISLHPDADTWVDTERLPDLVIDDTAGEMAAWNLVAQTAFSVTRSNWTTHWFGIENPTPLQIIGQETRTVTTTTIVPERVTQNLGDRVVDVSIVPFMRRIAIVTLSTGMKPNTVMYPFFDNIPIDPFFLPLNNIVLENSIFGLVNDFRTVGNPVPAEIKDWNNPSNSIKVLISHASGNNVHLVQDPVVQPVVWGSSPIFGDGANTYLKILAADLVTPLPTLPEVQLVGGNLIANIKSYIHNGGVLTGSVSYPSGATTIKISNVVQWNVSNVQNMVQNYSYYVGDTITFIKERNIFIATITDYNQSTTELTFSPGLPFEFNRTTNGPSYYIIGKPRTDIYGALTGIFFVPPGTFRTGPKSFRLIDNSLNDVGSSSSWGDASFYSRGLLQTIQTTIISTVEPRIVSESTIETRPIYYDPIAQTFAVDPVVYPKGIFLSKVRVCFKTKDDGNVPVTLQLRPTVNGYPSSTEIYPYSSIVKMPQAVKVTDAPNLNDPTKYTEFIFDSPVYLLPGEHCFVLLSDSNKYEIWAAEMGGRDIVTSSIISEQPYGGSFFKSQNARTWSAEQNIDMTFALYRCKFSTNPAFVKFKIRADQVTANHNYDLVCVGVTDIQPSGTSINYSFDSISNDTNAYTDYKDIVPTRNYQLDDGAGMRMITTEYSSNSFYLRAILLSDSTDVSPVIKRDTLTLHAVKNIINDLELSEDDIVILDGGSNYTSNASVLVTGGGGSGANAYAVRDTTTNKISKIIFDSPGSGYMSNPTISVYGGGLSASGANVIYNGETSKSGGNAEVRHLTKVITLADGFDSADLRVYITAYKPAGSKIFVYYKVIAESDPETLADKSWQLMTQLGQENVFSENKTQFREITYSPGENGIPSNLISYDGYGTFKSFQIKVVTSCVDSTDPPRINDLRVVALPGEST